MSLPKRTAKDEADYNLNLRREEPIKTEVIVELRNHNRALLEAQVRILEALIQANDSLRVYRMASVAAVKFALASSGSCAPGCTKHEWHNSDGWHYKVENE